MQGSTQQRMEQLLEQLRLDPGLPDQLPGEEAAMVRAALAGESIYAIASGAGAAESRVWQVLSSAARQAAGRKIEQVETGGLGSDTDPGVTGGYGDTGFGSIGNEPPEPIPDEPEEASSERGGSDGADAG